MRTQLHTVHEKQMFQIPQHLCGTPPPLVDLESCWIDMQLLKMGWGGWGGGWGGEVGVGRLGRDMFQLWLDKFTYQTMLSNQNIIEVYKLSWRFEGLSSFASCLPKNQLELLKHIKPCDDRRETKLFFCFLHCRLHTLTMQTNAFSIVAFTWHLCA